MSRPSSDYRTTSKEAYNDFIKKHPQYPITYDAFKKVIYKFNELVSTYALETGNRVKLPFGLGTICISKFKPARYAKTPSGGKVINLPVDWKATKEQGKKIYHLNYHTDGYKFHWMWRWRDCRVRSAFIWKFEPSRRNSRLLKEYLTKPDSQYKYIYKEWVKSRNAVV